MSSVLFNVHRAWPDLHPKLGPFTLQQLRGTVETMWLAQQQTPTHSFLHPSICPISLAKRYFLGIFLYASASLSTRDLAKSKMYSYPGGIHILPQDAHDREPPNTHTRQEEHQARPRGEAGKVCKSTKGSAQKISTVALGHPWRHIPAPTQVLGSGGSPLSQKINTSVQIGKGDSRGDNASGPWGQGKLP